MRFPVLFADCTIGRMLCPALLVALFAGPVHAKEQKVHGYVTAVHGPASFDIDDYRILRDQSVTIEFVTDEDDQNAADYPKDIRVGSEIEIRGDYDGQTHILKAKSVKVYTRESRKLKRAAILDQVPQLHRSGAHWAGSFRADGQTIVVDETTIVAIVPNASQKSAMRQEAKEAKQTDAQTAERMLARLDDVHVNMYVSYEGARLDDGRIRAKKVQFRDKEMTASKARLWKSLAPSISSFKGAGPGVLNIGAGGRYKLTPNAEVQNYVRNLGQRLVPASQRGLPPGDPNRIPFQFFVAESNGVNAFAEPNGVVVVHRETLAMVETEGELAAVIGHEIAHATQEHMLRQMEFHKKKRILLEIGIAVAEAYGKYSVRDLLTLASAAIRNGYQRYLENQADRVGMEYMIAAGYDPREAPRVWKTMSSNMGDGPINFFWSDHDNHTTRRSYLMSELAVNYKGVEFDSLEKDSPEFHRVRAMLGGRHSNALADLPKARLEVTPPPVPHPPDQLATFDPNLKPQIPGELAAGRPLPHPPSPQPAVPSPQPAARNPRTDAGTLDRAYEALRTRDYDSAIAGFLKGIEADPARVSVRRDLAYTYLKVGENSLARRQFQEAMRLDPDNSQVAMEYAFLCYEAKEEAQARRIFDRIRKTGDPTAEAAFQNIDGPLAAGIERWKKAIEIGANDFSAHFELATLAEQRDDLALAAEHYEKAWRLLPDRRSVLVDLGRVWKALDRGADATAALLAASRGGEARAAEMARELLPERYPYVDEIRHALDLDSGNVELRRELGYLLLSMGRQPEAEQEFRGLAEGPAGDLLSATQLGLLLYARDDRQGAIPLFDRVLAGKDEDLSNRVRAVLHAPQVVQAPAAAPTAHDSKVMAERSIKAGYMNDAVKYLLMAHEADPGDPETMARLGWAYNILHQDTEAFHWFGLARRGTDPEIAAEAEHSWRGLRSANERFRTTAWLFPMFSTRWHDAFGYGQIKTEVRTGLGFRLYVSTRFVGDSRRTVTPAGGPPQYLSESSVIAGVGLVTKAWHGVFAWGEAGRSFNYLTHVQMPDYRGGLSFSRGTGHSLRGESPGWFGDTTVDAVFISRFGNEVLFYDHARLGYTAGPKALRLQIYGDFNLTLDDQRQYWANFGQAGPAIRLSGSWLPESMYFTFEALRGVYLINTDNPRRPNFYDYRAGFWYAFTH